MSRCLDPFSKARWEAENLLKELGIDDVPINPSEIARELGIELQPLPDDAGGASGMLLHVEGQFGICYPTHVTSEGFKRFSIAHEIGHYRLPGHVDAIFSKYGEHVSNDRFQSTNKYEREADHFAAALLMPATLFAVDIKHAGDGLEAIETLASKYETSLEATALRYTQTSRDPVAVIRSEGRSIDYAFMSDSLKDFPDLDWIRKGMPLPVGSVTAAFNASKINIKNAESMEGISDLQEWFNAPHGQKIMEEVVGLGSYGKTLTVLTGMEPPDEIENEEGELEELRGMRFSR